MKKALALIGTIIFVFSIVPMGAFATDSDYSDHTSNIAPYVDTIIRGFTDSNNVVRHTLHIDDVELWQEGLPLGIYQLTAQVPADCDVIDIDLYFDAGDLMTDQYYQLFDIYITGLANIDYIEFYQHTTYRSFPIYYATYHQNRLYVMTAANVIQSGSYTIRVHIKRGGFTISYYNDILPYVYLRELTDLTTTETLAQWYYLTAMLRELDTLQFNVSSMNIDLTNVTSSLTSIQNVLQNARLGTIYRPVDYGSDSFCYGSVYYLNSAGQSVNNAYNFTRVSNDVSSVRLNDNYAFSLCLDISTPSPYINIYIPVTGVSEFYQNHDYKVSCCFLLNPLRSSAYFNTYTNFDQEYSDFCFYRFTHSTSTGRDYQIITIFNPYFHLQQGQTYQYIYFRFMEQNTSVDAPIWYDFSVTFDNQSYYAWINNVNSQVGFENTALMYFQRYNFLLEQMVSNWTNYPSGPSDPQDPNQTTNIYDVNIEFNTQVGDISVFENTYSQQLPTYDQSISDQYLVPVSNSYDFSDLNSTFNSIWQSSFQYDTDEEDNITGVYGIGLYFIIPLVLLVLFALFRRVTS